MWGTTVEAAHDAGCHVRRYGRKQSTLVWCRLGVGLMVCQLTSALKDFEDAAGELMTLPVSTLVSFAASYRV